MNVNDRSTEKVLGVDIGDRCCKTGLDCWKAGEVGESAGVVGKRVGREDLLGF